GISKFSKISLFSVLNNLLDISLLPEFNDLVGFTESELVENFAPHLEAFATKLKITKEELMEKLRYWYNGYSWDGQQRIYNPWSIINSLAASQLENYWFGSGTPDFLIRLIQKKHAPEQENPLLIEDFQSVSASSETFDSYDLENISLTALLFQAGYLTIREAKVEAGGNFYLLGYPNNEVRWSLSAHILGALTTLETGLKIKPKALMLRHALSQGDQESFRSLIRSIFAGIPSELLKRVNEYYYQSVFYFFLNMLGVENVVLEQAGYIGKADGALVWNGKIYIFEFKFAREGSMKSLLDAALKQVETKGYHHPYAGSGKTIWAVAIGILFKSPAPDKPAVLAVDVEWKALA
ncbi:MAG: AAA family ATPase, partial [Bacteroidota bacterium]